MVKRQRLIVSTLSLNRAYELSLLYFKNLGFFEIQQTPNQYIKFQRGSDLTGHNWQTKKVYLTLQFSLTQDNKVTITCTYDISALLYIGEKDLESADREIFGFRDYLGQVEKRENKKPMRICPKCKREIPWDAKICPYCGYDFREVKKEQLSLIQEESKKNVKICPNCGKEVPIDALFCPYCGYSFYKTTSDEDDKSLSLSHEKDKSILAEKYALYGIIWGILGILLFSLLGILGIYYGWKARKLDKSKGTGGIILGILSLTVVLFFDIYLLFSLI